MKAAILMLAVLFPLVGLAYDSFPPDLLDNVPVQQCFYCVFEQSGFGLQKTEVAAWVYQEGSEMKCQFWPATGQIGKQTWPDSKPIPQPLLALVHSHPTGLNWKADDDGDQKAARQVGAPNYVVSSHGVWKFDPSNSASFQVADRDIFSRVHKTLPKNFCKKFEVGP